MTIRTAHQATIDHRDTLTGWGDPAILGAAEGSTRLAGVRSWAARSPTAQHVLSVVDVSPKQIDLVCLHGGDTVFDADTPAPDRAIVFWNVDACYSFEQNGTQTLHPYVVLLHELGHAVQWITNPLFFGGTFPQSPDAESRIRDGGRALYTRMAEGKQITGFAATRRFIEARMQMSGPSRSPLPWSPRIEIDNLYRHEWPICDEAGLPRRQDYASVRKDMG